MRSKELKASKVSESGCAESELPGFASIEDAIQGLWAGTHESSLWTIRTARMKAVW
jgi:hypothetical protein